MATLRVDTLDFHFQTKIDAWKYDASQHYQTVWQNGHRAVDVVATEMGANPQLAWLIEAKDYRNLHGQPKDFTPSEIASDVFRKVNDTLDGLADAAANAVDPAEMLRASRATTAATRQIVFHLEPYQGPATKLFPRDPSANVLQKLKQSFGAVTPPPMVLNIATTRRANVPWTVS
jgi:hypothetical protein